MPPVGDLGGGRATRRLRRSGAEKMKTARTGWDSPWGQSGFLFQCDSRARLFSATTGRNGRQAIPPGGLPPRRGLPCRRVWNGIRSESPRIVISPTQLAPPVQVIWKRGRPGPAGRRRKGRLPVRPRPAVGIGPAGDSRDGSGLRRERDVPVPASRYDLRPGPGPPRAGEAVGGGALRLVEEHRAPVVGQPAVPALTRRGLGPDPVRRDPDPLGYQLAAGGGWACPWSSRVLQGLVAVELEAPSSPPLYGLGRPAGPPSSYAAPSER
jgi:hypothetical protein